MWIRRWLRVAPSLGVMAVLVGVACAPTAPSAPAAQPTAASKAPAPTSAPAASPIAARPSPMAAASPSPAAGAAAAKPAAAAAPTLSDAEKAEAEAFYRGKTVRITVGFGAGGGYDIYARLTAKYLPKYLPGSPTIVVDNQPGAGSLTAANTIYNTAPKDGTVIGTFSASNVLVQALGAQGGAAKFDPAKFPWLGAPAVISDQCMVRTSLGIDSMQTLISSQKPVVFAASALGNNTAVLASIMQQYLDKNIKIVTGYDGIAAVKLAVERGEADAACGSWEAFKPGYADWLTGNPPFARVLVKARPDPFNDLQDVPELSTFLPEEGKQVLALGEAPQAAGFVYAAPPDVPAARLKALEAALYQAWTDADFKAEADKANQSVAPRTASAIRQIFQQLLAASPDQLKKTQEVLGIK